MAVTSRETRPFAQLCDLWPEEPLQQDALRFWVAVNCRENKKRRTSISTAGPAVEFAKKHKEGSLRINLSKRRTDYFRYLLMCRSYTIFPDLKFEFSSVLLPVQSTLIRLWTWILRNTSDYRTMFHSYICRWVMNCNACSPGLINSLY